MQSKEPVCSRAFPATASVVILAAAIGIATLGASPRAASPLPAIVPALGKTTHYRITRIAQGNTGPRTGVSIVTLHRKSATSLTIKGVFDQPSVLTAVTVGADNVLQIPNKDDATSAVTSSLGDIVNGLNRLTGLFAGKKNAPRDGWSASVHLADAGVSAPVLVPIAVVNARAGDYELHGVGEVTIQPKALPNQGAFAPRGLGGPPGNRFRVGGGFIGDALPNQSLPNGQALAAGSGATRQAITVAISIDGRIRRGAIAKISLVETRSVTLDALPYVNVSGWTIDATK